MGRYERLFYMACIAILVLLFAKGGNVGKAALLTQFEDGFTSIVQRVAPVVVNVSAEGTVNRSPFGDQFKGTPFEEFFQQFMGRSIKQHFTSLGSGMLVRKDGYVLTNVHVIRGASNISVILSNGTTLKNAKVIGTDSRFDIAVIKVSSPQPLPEGVLGDSDQAKVGSWAIAIGNPFGFNSTVTIGVISAKGRNLPGESDATYHNLIQTDAAINPGNSGGALVNIRGEIIGINTSIATPSGGSVGIGFAIPINAAKAELSELITKGKVVHGWLGVYLQTITPDLASTFGVNHGVLVSDVAPNSPAEEAGLKRADVIVRFNDRRVESAEMLQDFISQVPVGSAVTLEVLRDKKPVTVHVTIQAMPSHEENAEISTYFGLHLESSQNQPNGGRPIVGLTVVAVDPSSAAASAQIMSGDRVLEVNRYPVNTVSQFKQMVKRAQGTTVVLLIDHSGILRYVALPKTDTP